MDKYRCRYKYMLVQTNICEHTEWFLFLACSRVAACPCGRSVMVAGSRIRSLVRLTLTGVFLPWLRFFIPWLRFFLPWLRFFHPFSSVTGQMPRYNSQRWGHGPRSSKLGDNFYAVGSSLILVWPLSVRIPESLPTKVVNCVVLCTVCV
jgi:hypothetical protein